MGYLESVAVDGVRVGAEVVAEIEGACWDFGSDSDRSAGDIRIVACQ